LESQSFISEVISRKQILCLPEKEKDPIEKLESIVITYIKYIKNKILIYLDILGLFVYQKNNGCKLFEIKGI
jgi:hypothetical protein